MYFGFNLGSGVSLSTYKPSITYQWSDNIFKYQTLQEDSLGSELITNGTFDSSLSGWTYDSLHFQWTSGVIEKYGYGSQQHAYQTISTNVGSVYVMEFDCLSKTLDPVVSIDGNYAQISDLVSYSGGIYTSGTYACFSIGKNIIVFEATSTSHSFGVSGYNGLFTVDNISVKEVLANAGDNVLDNRGTTGTTNDALVYSGRAVELGATNTLDIPIHNNGGTGSFLTYYDVDNKEMVTLGNSVDGADSRTEELVVNGGFDSDSDWNKTNATISDGKGYLSTTDGSYASLFQQGIAVIGKTYSVSIDIADIVGAISITIGAGTDVNFTTNGTKTFIITATETNIDIKRQYGTTIVSATIDNISVKEVLPVSTTYQFLDKTINNIYTHTQPWSDADWTAINNNPNLLGELAINGSSDALSYTRQVGDAYYPCVENSGEYVVDNIAGYGSETRSVSVSNSLANETLVDNLNGTWTLTIPNTASYPAVRLIIEDKYTYLTSSKLALTKVTLQSGAIVNNEIQLQDGTGNWLYITSGTQYAKITNNSTRYIEYNFYSDTSGIPSVYLLSDVSVREATAQEIANYISTVRTNSDFLTQGLQTTAFETDALGVIQSYTPEKLVFNGDGRYVDTGWSPPDDKPWTIECVMETIDDESSKLIGINTASPSNRFYIGQHIGGGLYGSIGGINIGSYGTIVEDGTYHICVTFDGLGNGIFFVNSTTSYPYLSSPYTALNGEKFFLGASSREGSYYSNPIKKPIHLFKVHNKALTADEVADSFNAWNHQPLLESSGNNIITSDGFYLHVERI